MPTTPADKAKAKRSGLLASITKKVKAICEELDQERDKTTLEVLKGEVEIKLDHLQEANEVYIEHLTEQHDVEEAYLWFAEHEETVLSYTRKISSTLAELGRSTKTDGTDYKTEDKTTLETSDVKPTTSSNQPRNTIDAWIDELDINAEDTPLPSKTRQLDTNEILLKVMYEKESPNIELPDFDGFPLGWPNFIQRFHEHVHRQPYLNDFRRMTILAQHLKGKAAQITSGLGTDRIAYVTALQALKQRFAHPTLIARAFIDRVTKGDTLPDHDRDALEQFHINIRDCVITLKRLKYDADIKSCETTRQATLRLPIGTRERWAEHCRKIRMDFNREPHLEDMESWLSDRVSALYDPLLYVDKKLTRRLPRTTSFAVSTEPQTSKLGFETSAPVSYANNPFHSNKPTAGRNSCLACKSDDHPIHKCGNYLAMSPEQRMNFVRANRLCCNCLRPGHSYKYCRSFRCTIERCHGKHHTTLHDNPSLTPRPPLRFQQPPASNRRHDRQGNRESPSHTTPKLPDRRISDPVSTRTSQTIDSHINSTSSDGETACGHTTISSSLVYLQILPVRILSPAGTVKRTFAMLDNGSQSTLIRSDIADELGLDGTETQVTIGTISGKTVRYPSRRVQFSVSGRDDNEEVFDIPWAWTVPALNIPSQRFKFHQNERKLLSEVAGYQFQDIDSSQIGVLIGANAPDALLQIEIRRPPTGNAVAIRTGLGWTIMGRASTRRYSDVPSETSSYALRTDEDQHIDDLLERFWTTESFGCKYEGQKAMSAEDRQALHLLQSQTKLVSGRYEVPMLWKDVSPHLPNNYFLALKRFRYLQAKLRKDPERFKRYSGVIHTHLRQGYASKMSSHEVNQTSPITYYLPHHDVYNINKPGKTRVVQDAAARFKGISLNDKLVTGPDLLTSLVSVLLNFRSGEIALVSDIESMFHRCLVNTRDKDCLRFLWSDNVNSTNPDIYQMNVHIFGAKSSPTCANYALQRCANDNANRFSPNTIETILRQFYVDDMVTSQPSASAAVSLANELIEILKLGGFRLTKWVSNSREVLGALPSSELAHQDIDLDFDNIPAERVLGLRWEPDTDALIFRTIQPDPAITKRGILKTTASLFDPLGFLAPFILLAKRLMQEIWKQKIGWDQQLPDDISRQWQTWIDDLHSISAFRLPRCYSPHFWNATQIQLHIFADASEYGLSAVAYFRIVSPSETVTTAFVMGKTRNAPIKSLTIVRLELQAAVLASRLAVQIRKDVSRTIHQSYLWTDSMVILKCIKNTSRRFNTFTSNRVTEIRQSTNPEDWNHVPTHLNPADDGSRGLRLSEIVRPHHRWLHGPTFLLLPEHSWPHATSSDEPEEATDPMDLETIIVGITPTHADATALFDPSRYSSLLRLERVTAWILRFVSNLKIAVLNRKNLTTTRVLKSPLTPDEIGNALHHWVAFVQKLAFQKELISLKSGQLVHKDSPLNRLSPVLDGNLLRVGGRLDKAPLTYDARHQFVLPNRHHICDLIVRDAHEKTGHHGQEHVLSFVRQCFWILKARVLVRRIVRSCVICIRRRTVPRIPTMASLPETRLALNEPVFASTGVDYYGPLYVRRGRGTDKRWVCLFTCMTVRAVHIEIVGSLESDAFILALKRFAARRGCPRVISSDNAKTFTGADRELRTEISSIDNEKIADVLSAIGIQWHYSPPYAPHFGGVWERLVRSVKKTMKIVLGHGTFHEDVLYTALVETEAIVNSRPLTAVSDDPSDLQPITPNHFLIGRAYPGVPPTTPVSDDKNHQKRWRRAQAIAQHIWKRFRTEYIPQLTPRSKWRQPAPQIRKNDLVLITDDQTPRYQWSTGRVTRPIAGPDGRVRVAEVLTAKGTVTRPVSRLCLLEGAQELGS